MDTGELVAGRFEIEALVAAGGMGLVHRALDRETGAKVALKTLAGRGVRNMERFSYEALVLAELRHPGIVRYVAHGATPAGELYLAMDWLEGEDLSARLERAGMTVDESVTLVRGVAEALAVAHARGIVHRDIKPSNVFLVDGDVGRPTILDFGVARLGYGRSLATRTGALLGTPGYLAPEQAEGRKDVDARADVFSLGCVFFECLTGRRAFVGEHVMALLSRILLEEAPRVREIAPAVPPALDHLVATMLSKSPEGRPRDAAVVLASLDALGTFGPTARAPALPSASALTAGEQRLLCVVLATPLGDAEEDANTQPTLTPDAALERLLGRGALTDLEGAALGRTLEELRGAARVFGGRLERFADGSLLAVHTGADATDSATRAACSALALRALLPGIPMAVATGRGIVAERLPVGEAVESAAKALRSARRTPEASAGRIRLDEVTARLIEGRFVLQADGAGAELVGERGRDARTLLGQPTPCVGRDRELAGTSAIFEEGLSEPAARAVLLTGAPGVGKSRLAAEIVARLTAGETPPSVWIARGDPMQAGASFAMLAQLVRQAADLEGGAPHAQQHERLRARLAACVPSADVDRIAVFLAEIVGAHFPADHSVELSAARRDAMLMGDQMRRAFEDWIEAECARGPVLLVLEDLHHGDLPTVRFIDAALRHLRDRPLLVLAVARPEVTRVFPGLWCDRAFHEVRVGELGKRACEQLVRRALGASASAETAARLVERSAGNPFYLEELIRAAAGGKGVDALPGTVLAMVQARLEDLEPAERRALRAASVFGQVFWPAGVGALLGGAEAGAGLDAVLRGLVERELVARRGTRRFAGHDEHAFRQAPVREAAYASLTDHDRMLGHRLAAAWLETVGETGALVLAQHFERGGELPRAAIWYQRAADDALEGNDFAGVIEHAERAVGCGATGEAAGRLRFRQAEAHRWRGEFAEAERRGLEAISLLARGSDEWMGAVGEMATVLGKLGSTDRVAELGQALLDAAPDPSQAGDARVSALSRTSTSLLLMGRFDLAESLHEALVRAVGDPAAERPAAAAWLHRARAFRAPFRGETGSSARYFADSAAAFDATGDVRNACLQRANYGASCLEVGDWEGAERALGPAIAEADRMGAKHIVSSAQRDLGYALARRGAFDEALSMLRAAVEEFAAHGDRRLEGVGRDEIAFALLSKGDLAAAELEARTAVERLEVAPAYQCHALATLSRVLLRRGAVAEALDRARRARSILAEVGALEEGEGLVRLALAEAQWAAGHDEEGCRTLAEARAEIERRSAQIVDPAARTTFLEAIPEHVETMALSRERLGG